MGLMHHADFLEVDRNKDPGSSVSRSVGLLQKIIASSEYDRVCSGFSGFCTGNGFSRGLLLTAHTDYIVPIAVTGFDLTTARRFILNKSSISAVFPDNTGVKSFSGARKEYFSQLFSSHEWSSLDSIYTVSLSVSGPLPLYILCASSKLDDNRSEYITDFSGRSILRISEQISCCTEVLRLMANSFDINQTNDAIASKISGAFTAGMKKTLLKLDLSELFPDEQQLNLDFTLQTLHSAILHHVYRKVGASNIMYQVSAHDIRIALFSSQPIDTEIYKLLLTESLNGLFGTHRVSRILCTFIDTSNSSDTEFKNLILGER